MDSIPTTSATRNLSPSPAQCRACLNSKPDFGYLTNCCVKKIFTEQDVGKQELAAPMIHYLLTHFKSKFLHPPTAVGNRRHGGTGALPRAASVPPKRERRWTAFHVAAEVKGKIQHMAVHQGREGILGKAWEVSKARSRAILCEAVAEGRGRQPRAAGQAVLWAGKGEAGRLSCEMSPAMCSLSELQQAAHVLYTPVYLAGKGEDLMSFISPQASWGLTHGGPAVNPLTTQMNIGMCSWLLQLQPAHAGEGSPVNVGSVCSASCWISVLKRAAHDTCWFLKAI